MNLPDLKKKYYEEIFGLEDPLLKKIREKALEDNLEFMQLSPADAHILQFLTLSTQTKKAVEIGGLYGYSTLHIARGLKKEGRVFSLDIDKNRQKLSQKLLEGEAEFSKIRWISGDAHKSLRSSELIKESPFDLIFIDADKAGYLDYLLWAETYLKIGGIVVIDNSFLFQTLYAKEPELSQLKKNHGVSEAGILALRKMTQKITSSRCWKSAMIPTEDGLCTAVKIKEPTSCFETKKPFNHD